MLPRALPLALALLAAGCLEAAPAHEPLDAAATDAAAPPEPLGLAGARCFEGGGHSVHPRSLWEQGVVQVVPEPWVPADVIEDVGPQLLFSELPDPARPVPEEGNTMGNYHATMWCESWSLDGEPRDGLFFGFVGMRVERPEWSDDAPTHHYVVTVVATNDDDLLARLGAGGIQAFRATADRVELPDGTLRIQMWTEGNGDYDSVFKPKADGEMHATHVRLWWQRPLDGHAHGHAEGAHAEGAFEPVALDLVATGGEHLVAEAQGYFSHSGTDHHAPLPGAYGHTAAVMFRDFDRVIEWGPRTNITLGLAYAH